jgi:ELWxxDGT repeat protein
LEHLEDRCLLSADAAAALVADIVPGAVSSNPYGLTNVNGTLYFSTDYGLYKSDGTAASTVQINSQVYGSGYGYTPLRPGSLLFYGYSDLGSGLYKTDGTAGGTVFLKQVRIESHITVAGGKAFFAGYDSANGTELWVSDGTAAGTKLVKDIYGGSLHYSGSAGGTRHDPPYSVPRSSRPQELTSLNGALLFTAENEKTGRQLWRSDGTAKGTVMVTSNGVGLDLVNFNGFLYFSTRGSGRATTTAGTCS